MPTAAGGTRPSDALARGSYCLDGLATNFVDYLQELAYFAAEVLPRLVRLGLRAS